MKCSKCGFDNALKDKFCKNCGNKLTENIVEETESNENQKIDELSENIVEETESNENQKIDELSENIEEETKSNEEQVIDELSENIEEETKSNEKQVIEDLNKNIEEIKINESQASADKSVNQTISNSNDNNQNNKIFLIVGIAGIILAILAIIFSVGIYLKSRINDDCSYENIEVNESINEENENIEIDPDEDTQDDNSESTNKEPVECKVERKVPLSSEELNLISKVAGWRNGGYDYRNKINKTSSEFDTYDKVSAALYNLGFFSMDYESIPKEGCYIDKSKIDAEIANIFKDTSYNPSNFVANEDMPLNFRYSPFSEQYFVYPYAKYGRLSAIGYTQQAYDTVKGANDITFKTKYFICPGDGLVYTDSTGKDVEVPNSSGVKHNDDIFGKFGDYANIYEWHFVKNSKGVYVFDNMKKIK